MQEETNLFRDIRISEENPRADATCKRLLANKEILARILKGCVQEYADCNVDDIADKYIEGDPMISQVSVMPDTADMIHGMANEDASPTEGRITYDIRFLASVPDSKDSIGLIINVEPQNNFNQQYPLLKRAIYYCSRMISAQNGPEFTHSHYEKIKKVYSIWICLAPPMARRNTITQYYITEKNLVGNVKEPVRNYDLLSVVMVCLGQEEQTHPELLKLLNMLFSSQKAENKILRMRNEFHIRVTQELENEVLKVCDLREVFFDQGIELGLERGLKQGIERGIERGRIEERIISIQNVMQSMGCSAKQAMDILKIPKSEYTKYLNLLEQ